MKTLPMISKTKEEKDTVKSVVLYEDKITENNSDEWIDRQKENKTEFNFYFPSDGEPINSQGTFDNNASFALALLKGEMSTLLFKQSSDFVFDDDVDLTQTFPIQFPFGFGGINDGKD